MRQPIIQPVCKVSVHGAYTIYLAGAVVAVGDTETLAWKNASRALRRATSVCMSHKVATRKS